MTQFSDVFGREGLDQDCIARCATADFCFVNGCRRTAEAKTQRRIQKLERVRQNAAAFRAAIIESGALSKVPQSLYFDQLRALEAALYECNQP